ncbi:hypothetical protein COLO4_00026 [Corchorus olitorius]|uniref:Uncharacterized protein n=1 Tax=Corchorus olitorius TaxID=93759 RepID=A0A1R3L4V9_9ROSI|nr:hypothetical protein COLO4_00026 [Corchorus olitorius]
MDGIEYERERNRIRQQRRRESMTSSQREACKKASCISCKEK